ncbi:hypothetical protein ISU10_22270 [Nocardioides agariphilus]|uniref:TfuA-like core domain-containing protein n=1 Tax=Nocardioides agariphilus TaxID=433664 RepID=A0A930VPG5_9ACTN|nr:TfuA-like protein [Nocardioides agariphilus]MBF4770508.1 hypothetical protein [Nocardioides agariphilus]
MSLRGPLVAFLGPSLPPTRARQLAPEVVVLPPVCQGDLASAVRNHQPRAVLVVDGEFGQSLSVWHKEILWAIDRGVRVLGSSSMGALRAAELERFGMEGVGAVFAHYRDGWLTSDADVALVHADADEDYRALTWPLVNVRATVDALRAAASVDDREAHALVASAGALHFRMRGEVALARQLGDDGLPADEAARLAHLVSETYVDQKRLDAEAALAVLVGIDEIRPPVAERPLDLEGLGLEPLLWSDVLVERSAGRLRRYQLVADAALHEPDYPALMDRALDGYLVDALALEYDVRVTSEEVAEQRATMHDRLGVTEEGLEAWLADNDLDRPTWEALVVREATRARMRRWMLTTRIIERNRRLLVEQLQVEGRYARVADAAARRRALADARPAPPYPDSVKRVQELIARQRAVSGWAPKGDLRQVADDLGFDTVAGLLVALSDAAVAGLELQERRSRMTRLLGLGDDEASP